MTKIPEQQLKVAEEGVLTQKEILKSAVKTEAWMMKVGLV